MGGNHVQATEQTNINIYNVMGALVRTVRLEQGLNTIEGLSQGQIYVVKDSEAIKGGSLIRPSYFKLTL